MIKRLFDVCAALTGLLLLSPLLLAVAAAIRLDSPGPVFFRQERIGRHGRPFRIYKFRTMVVDAEAIGAQVSTAGDPRITRCGAIIRRSKLDELPQLINVLLGDMSLVGPRPEVPRYVERFSADYAIILQVRPGITDFASIEYRHENELLQGADDPEEVYLREILPAKIALYRKYLRERSLWLDVKLIFSTLRLLFR